MKKTREKLSPQQAVEAYLGCEMLRIPYCADSRFADGGNVVSFTPQKHYFSASGTHFC
jgi:hypothetical protein